MLSVIKQVFIVSLNFNISLAAKCMPSNDEPRMVRPTLIDLNPFEIIFDPFTISLDKCSGSCSVLSPKEVFQKKKKSTINVKVFNMIKNKYETKTMTKPGLDCKCKFNSTTCN